ncbi:MAG: hypothetical protein IT379_41710 [Deltaproteobacteria bacterium]|nr:hypothetical protein [Deltaproteobacteria bacterium]
MELDSPSRCPRRSARPGDHGAYVTAAEWLDVNYGRLVRELPTSGLVEPGFT